MCKMKVVVLREMLGAREICWSVWDGKQVQEMTSNQIKTLLKAGTKVSGLKVSKDGELEPDQEGFYCKNIMEHRHCGNYTPMFSEECMANLFYIVIGKHEEKGVTVYDCISTKWEQVTLSESDVKAYIRIGIISAGAKLDEDKIVVAPVEEVKVESKPVPEVKTEEKVEEKPEKKEEPVKAEEKKAEVKEEPVKTETKPEFRFGRK